jgi:hypothetical protein
MMVTVLQKQLVKIKEHHFSTVKQMKIALSLPKISGKKVVKIHRWFSLPAISIGPFLHWMYKGMCHFFRNKYDMSSLRVKRVVYRK